MRTYLPCQVTPREISLHAFFRKAILPEGSTFWLINPVALTRCRNLAYSAVGIIKTERRFLFG